MPAMSSYNFSTLAHSLNTLYTIVGIVCYTSILNRIPLATSSIDIPILRHSKNIQNAIQHLPKWYCWTTYRIFWFLGGSINFISSNNSSGIFFTVGRHLTLLQTANHIYRKNISNMSIYFWDRF
jgi:hypothetical protein